LLDGLRLVAGGDVFGSEFEGHGRFFFWGKAYGA
jgi:hypothetical protein